MRNFEYRLQSSMQMLTESKYLEPAIIRMHRGTVIEVDHVVETDSMYIVGIGYNVQAEHVTQAILRRMSRSVRSLFSQPYYGMQKRYFNKILTINKENVADIQYI